MSEKKYAKCPECGAPCEVIEEIDVQDWDGDITEVPYDQYVYQPQLGHESPAEQPVVDKEQPGAMIYPDIEAEAKEHAKIITDNAELQLYVAQGYYNAMAKKRAEQPVREVEAVTFTDWVKHNTKGYDPIVEKWVYGENEYRYTTTELYNLFKGRPAEWSGEKEGTS